MTAAVVGTTEPPAVSKCKVMRAGFENVKAASSVTPLRKAVHFADWKIGPPTSCGRRVDMMRTSPPRPLVAALSIRALAASRISPLPLLSTLKRRWPKDDTVKVFVETPCVL